MTKAHHISKSLRWIFAMIWLVAFSAVAVSAQDETNIEESEKSLMFAGRCMAQMLNGAPPDVEYLNQLNDDLALGHLFGSPGQVFYGVNDRNLFVVHKPTHCGVNVFDETAEDMLTFLAYWLDRDSSPFELIEQRTEDNGNLLVAYSGHCTECGFDVHARGYWFAQEKFTIYRLYATKPEGSS